MWRYREPTQAIKRVLTMFLFLKEMVRTDELVFLSRIGRLLIFFTGIKSSPFSSTRCIPLQLE
jgi:hypothetical protein